MSITEALLEYGNVDSYDIPIPPTAVPSHQPPSKRARALEYGTADSYGIRIPIYNCGAITPAST